MPRGVAKAKDGDVDKKGKGVGKVVVGKRSRKMRGGGEFTDYCNSFIDDNPPTEARKNVKDMFENLKIIIMSIKTPYVYRPIKVSPETNKKNEALEIIRMVLDDGIDGIDNNKLKIFLVYISFNKDNIISIYQEKKDKEDASVLKEGVVINDESIRKLFQNILFLKIYKLFKEFADISSAVTIISDIQIKKASYGREEERDYAYPPSKDAARSSEDTQNVNRVGRRLTSDIQNKERTPKSALNVGWEQKEESRRTDPVNALRSKTNEKGNTRGDISDDESEDDFNIVGDAKSALMVLINDNTNGAIDGSIYKKLEKIKNNLNEDDEFEKYIQKVLNDLLFQKINDILDLLDKSSNTKAEIETFLLRVDDEKIREEIEGYKKDINQNFSTIDERKRTSKKEKIVNAKDELIRLFSIFRPKIKRYIQLLNTQTEPDDTKSSQQDYTRGLNISKDLSLFGISEPLNSNQTSLTTLPPLKSTDSTLLSQFVINDGNQKKLAVAEELKERYKKDMSEIDIILKEKDTYLDQQKIKDRVIILFTNIITLAFKILKFKKINEIEKDLSILDNYTTTSSNLIFSNMNRHVQEHYSNPATEHIVIQRTTDKINLLKTLFNNFNMFFSGNLNKLYKNNSFDKIWEAEGGQPQKPPTAKEPKNNKPKESTKTPKPKEPTKTPKPKEPTKTPKPKEPKNNKPKEPAKDP